MKHILIADNDETSLKKIISDLSARGFKTLSTNSAKKGFELALDGKPDLIISEINLDKSSGLALLQSLRRNEITKNIPVIVLSRNSNRDVVREAMTLGVSDYILKPYSINQLHHKISVALKVSRIKQVRLDDKLAQHIELRRQHNMIIISFKSQIFGKQIIEEAKKVFNPTFFKVIKKDISVLDLRNISDLGPNGALIIHRFVDLFEGYELYIVAGRHYGPLVAEPDLDEKVGLFISFGHLLAFIQGHPNNSSI